MSETQKKQPVVAAVIVTYNPDFDVHREQIERIRVEFPLVVVVDNASKSEGHLEIYRGHGNIRLIGLDQNLGLAAAQNIGLKEARRSAATHVVLFDQDSIIEEGFLNGLLQCEADLLRKSEKVACIGPVFYDPSTNKNYPATVYVGPFIRRVGIPEGGVAIATFIISSGSLMNLEVFDAVGEMREDLFIDYIDVEWCLRAKSKGYSSYISSSARMKHTIGDHRVSIFGRTISIHSPLRRYYLFRNSFLMLRLPYIPLGYKVREVGFNGLRFLIGLFFSEEKAKYLKYTFYAFSDGLAKRYSSFEGNRAA